MSSNQPCGNLGGQCWAHRDTTFDWRPFPLSDFDDETQLSTTVVAPYSDIMSVELETARNRGAKILMWHGGADPLIPWRQATHYYREASQHFGGYQKLEPWFRFYLAPGVGHCGGGVGPQPQNLFGVLVDWVENGIAPDTILSQNTSGVVVTRTRPLCTYPKTAKYLGGDPNLAASYECGGNLETPEAVCMDLVAPFQQETENALDGEGVPFARSCSASRGDR